MTLEAEDSLRLREDERVLLEEECAILLRQPLSPERLGQFQHLLDSARVGEIPMDQVAALESLLQVGLESGRIRSIHSAHGEMAASRLYARLPAGKALRHSMEAANKAMKSLEGLTLQSAEFRSQSPGSYNLTLQAGGRRITIAIRRAGLSVESAEVTL